MLREIKSPHRCSFAYKLANKHNLYLLSIRENLIFEGEKYEIMGGNFLFLVDVGRSPCSERDLANSRKIYLSARLIVKSHNLL